MTTIKLKNGSGAPTAGDLAQGEPALDLTNKRLYTEDSGGTVIEVGTNPTSVTTGDITATGTATFAGLTTTADVSFGDNDKAIFGAGSDLQIYHDGSHSYVSDQGTGRLVLNSSGGGVRIEKSPTENMAIFTPDGNCELFYDNSLKLATTSTGIDVTGTVTADGLTVESDSGVSSPTILIKDTDTSIAANQVLGKIDFEISDASNPAIQARIDAYSSATYGNPSLRFFTGDLSGLHQYMNIAYNGDISFYEDTGTTAKFHWDSSAESLGLGTSSPAAPLDIKLNTNSTADIFKFQRNDGAVAGVLNYSGTDGAISLGTTTSHDFTFDTAGTERMRIDSSGALGLGTTPPSTSTHSQMFIGTESVILGSSSGALDIGNNLYYNSGWKYRTTGAVTLQDFSASGNIVFYRAASGTANADVTLEESMRIDPNGNLLVGKTTSSYTTDGFEALAAGAIQVSDTNTNPVGVNRNGTDGSLISFFKSGTSVGSIGTLSSKIYVGSGDTSLFFDSLRDALVPHDASTNAARGSAIDLGRDVVKFKDLYLSGGAYLGGTGSANKLDDYEEGTWTPAVSAGAISGTSITYTGTYTKIGRQVYIYFSANSASGDINISSYVSFSGVPFSITYIGTGTAITEDIDQFDRQGYAAVNGTNLTISNAGSSSGTNSLTVGIVGTTS